MIGHLDQKNVKFELITKDEAKNILQTSNYFYKITAYRKNFEKNKYDKYVNLDFKLLQDLATIDMRLRYLVLQMCLDIEHMVKTQILTDITKNSQIHPQKIIKPITSFTKRINMNKDIETYNYINVVKEAGKVAIYEICGRNVISETTEEYRLKDD
ncbi:MAG TPA: Abi family protein [Bacillales bacterium]|nr:Abi family protein [Bacillales bacterium]